MTRHNRQLKEISLYARSYKRDFSKGTARINVMDSRRGGGGGQDPAEVGWQYVQKLEEKRKMKTSHISCPSSQNKKGGGRNSLLILEKGRGSL